MSDELEIKQFVVPANDNRKRLDRWLASQLPDLSRSQVSRLLVQKMVTIDKNVPRKAGVKISTGQIVRVQLPTPPPKQPQPEAIPLDILYEDEDVLVINKPARMVVHPAPGHVYGTLVSAALGHCLIHDAGQPQRPGIVHRLDRDTSGVIIMAKSERSRHILQEQFRQRQTQKEYLTLVWGKPETTRGTIEGPIGRHPTQRHKWAVVPNGRSAVTHYETLTLFKENAYLLVRPVTGRTHQIRVHLEAIGLPVVGDELYAPRRRRLTTLSRHFLHAVRLTLKTPDGQKRTFEAPLPEELQNLLDSLPILDFRF